MADAIVNDGKNNIGTIDERGNTVVLAAQEITDLLPILYRLIEENDDTGATYPLARTFCARINDLAQAIYNIAGSPVEPEDWRKARQTIFHGNTPFCAAGNRT